MVRPVFALINRAAEVVGPLFDLVTYNFGSQVGGTTDDPCVTAGDGELIIDGVNLFDGAGPTQLGSVPIDPLLSDEPTVSFVSDSPAYPQTLSGRDFPIFRQVESRGGTDRPSRYITVSGQIGGRGFLNTEFLAGDQPDKYGLYYDIVSTQQFNSSLFQGTGNPYTHGPAYVQFGDSSIGGSPTDGAVPQQFWPGHLMPSVNQPLQTNITALVNPGDTQVINVADLDLFHLRNNNDLNPALVVWTGRNGTATTWADEATVPVGSFQDFEFYTVIAASGTTGPGTLTIESAFTPIGTAIGAKLNHLSANSVVMPLIHSQGSIKEYNWFMNISQATGWPDAAGNTWPEFIANWMYTFSINNPGYLANASRPWMNGVDGANHVAGSGSTMSFEYSVLEHDVTGRLQNAQTFFVDLDGDNVADFATFDTGGAPANAGDFVFEHAMEQNLLVQKTTFTDGILDIGAVHGGGGVEEYYYDDYDGSGFRAQFNQVEYVFTNPQNRLDTVTTAENYPAEFDRAVRWGTVLSEYPHESHVLSKTPIFGTTGTGGTAIVDTQMFLNEWATSLHAGMSFAVSNANFPNDDTVTGSDRDPYVQYFAIDDVTGVSIGQTTAANQAAIQAATWIGQPMELAQLLGDQDNGFAFLTDPAMLVADYQFEGNAGAGLQGWQQIGTPANGSGSLTPTAAGLVFSNDEGFGFNDFQYRSAVHNADPKFIAGNDWVFYLELSATEETEVRIQIGNSNSYDQRLNVGPYERTKIFISKTLVAADLTSGVRSAIRVENGRGNADITLHRATVYAAPEINPWVIASNYTKALVLTNVTPKDQVVDLDGDYRVPTVGDNSVPQWATGLQGTVINSITLPSAGADQFRPTSIILQKVIVDTLEDDFADFLNNDPNSGTTSALSDPLNDTVSFCVPAGEGANYGPVITCDGDVDTTPTVTPNLTTCP